MMKLTLNNRATHRLSEFACLVDAIPDRFRDAILTAAVANPSDHELGSRPFVVSVRGCLRECVHASLGFEVSNDCWEDEALDAVWQGLSRFSACKDPAQTQLAVCGLISQVSEYLLSSKKARQS